MRAFTYIFAGMFPDIDAARCAYATPPDRSCSINHNFVPYAFLSSLLLGHGGIHGCTKFSILKNGILDNMHIPCEEREEIMAAFSKSQRCYLGLCRFARLWKIKRARAGCNETDLYMNPLSDLKHNLVMELFDDSSRTIYKFRLSDLIAISETSLSNSPEFFSDPQDIRNPYTNIPFTVAQLYTIYFKIKIAGYDIPLLFSQYYRSGFDLVAFCESNECYIRDAAINNFVKTGSDGEKYYYITKMLREHRRDLNGVSVHPGFPHTFLLNTFKKYLKDYLLETFSLHPGRKYRARIALQASLLRFGRLNPTYGRRVIELDDIESNETGRPEFRTSYVNTVVTRTPEVTPRSRRQRVNDNDSSYRIARRFSEVEPSPNDDEAERRAEANEYRAARALERDGDPNVSPSQQNNPIASTNPITRTLMHIASMRESIGEVSTVINRLSAHHQSNFTNDETALDESAPDETAPDETAPDETAPDETAPDETDPDETAPDETAPDEIAPDETAPDETAHDETASDEIAVEETLSRETVFEDTVSSDINSDISSSVVETAGDNINETTPNYTRGPVRLPPLDMASILRRYGSRNRSVVEENYTPTSQEDNEVLNENITTPTNIAESYHIQEHDNINNDSDSSEELV